MDWQIAQHGAGEPVLLIPGGGAADEFVPLVREPALASRYRLISYRRRAPDGAPVELVRHALDCAAVLDELGVPRAHVIGKSLGGAIALQFAVSEPSRVHSLTLLEPALFDVPGGAELFATLTPMLEVYRSGNPLAAVDGLFTAVWGPRWREEYARTVPGGPERIDAAAEVMFESELPAAGQWHLDRQQTATLNQPVLYVRGGDSLPIFAEGLSLLRSLLPQTEVTVLPGLNHLLQVRDPHAVATAIAGFLERHPLS